PPERRAFLQGANSERRALARERWLQSLPEDERESMRAMIDGFSPPERKAFRDLLLGTPAGQRDDLRREFLRLDPPQRSARLQPLIPPPPPGGPPPGYPPPGSPRH
ncbi:MAG TPA: hypothetical protein VM847_09390, partial [Tahibacter sp.]|nr:hypothetical protein [Tahibacter sp.]